MSASKKRFGVTNDGREMSVFRIQNASGAYADILDYGCRVQALCVPDKTGKLVDVTQGFDTAQAYIDDTTYMGAVVGRVGNRISKARFTLNGREYRVSANEGENCLHGGFIGFGKRFWEGETDGNGVTFTITAQDGEEGFPGSLTAKVRCTLTDAGEFMLDYTAESDADTVVNLTNHAYFNLAGGGDILSHTLKINASAITATSPDLIPNGSFSPVEGTPFDFRTAKPIGRDINDTSDINIRYAKGYDVNFVIDGQGFREFAQVYSPETGISMGVYSDLPGMQFYTGGMLPNNVGKGGVIHKASTLFCLETQNFPDAVNRPEFPSAILRKGEVYRTRTVFAFGVR
jgi:aldose 1-epimerase